MPGLFTGPAAKALGGVDIGWCVGLIVTTALYAWITRANAAAAERDFVPANAHSPDMDANGVKNGASILTAEHTPRRS
jgi:hypothetical protein